MTASDIIQRLGGAPQVSRDLKLPYTTVMSWAQKNSVPAWRQPALLTLAAEKSIPLSTTDFPPQKLRLTA